MIEQLADERRERAAVILSRLRSALATDESDAPLRPAIEEAVRQANALMLERPRGAVTPPAAPTPPAPPPQPPVPTGTAAPAPTTSRVVRQRAIQGAKASDTKASVEELLSLLAQKPSAKVNLTWEVVEE